MKNIMTKDEVERDLNSQDKTWALSVDLGGGAFLESYIKGGVKTIQITGTKDGAAVISDEAADEIIELMKILQFHGTPACVDLVYERNLNDIGGPLAVESGSIPFPGVCQQCGQKTGEPTPMVPAELLRRCPPIVLCRSCVKNISDSVKD